MRAAAFLIGLLLTAPAAAQQVSIVAGAGNDGTGTRTISVTAGFTFFGRRR